MSIFKRKIQKSDITLEERSMENKRAVLGLLKVLEGPREQMERWQDEIKGMKNEHKHSH